LITFQDPFGISIYIQNGLLLALEKYHSYWAFFEHPYGGYIYIYIPCSETLPFLAVYLALSHPFGYPAQPEDLRCLSRSRLHCPRRCLLDGDYKKPKLHSFRIKLLTKQRATAHRQTPKHKTQNSPHTPSISHTSVEKWPLPV